MPLADISGTGAIFYLHTDRLGTVQVATGTGGAVAWQGAYQPFGTVTAAQGLLAQNLRFLGQYADAKTGWSQNGWRDYDPAIGRYMEADPIGLDGGFNLYAYAWNDPIGFHDPRGTNPFAGAVEGGEVGGEVGAAFGGPVGAAAGAVVGASLGAYTGYEIVQMASNADRPPPGSAGIDETPWSGDHGSIKGDLGAAPDTDVKIDPNGGIWIQNPDGTWSGPDENGYADQYTGSGKASGRKGKDRRQRGNQCP